MTLASRAFDIRIPPPITQQLPPSVPLGCGGGVFWRFRALSGCRRFTLRMERRGRIWVMNGFPQVKQPIHFGQAFTELGPAFWLFAPFPPFPHWLPDESPMTKDSSANRSR